MSKPKKAKWTRDVLKELNGLASVGVKQAPATSLFDWCEHLTIEVDELDDVGILHQRDDKGPIQLCVFERHNEGEFAEVFERTLPSINALPEMVEQWRSFRKQTVPVKGVKALTGYQKWLEAVANEKRKIIQQVRESTRLRLAGEREKAWVAAGFDVFIQRRLPPGTPPLAKKQLLEDFDAITPDLLAWHLPRDDKGKWLMKRSAPLFRYDKRRLSAYCLYVGLPSNRSDRPTISAGEMQVDLQTARLDAAPEKYDSRRIDDFTQKILGVAKKDSANLWATRATSRAAQVRATRLQQVGEFEKAAEVAGVELDSLIRGCLMGRHVAHMCTCCAPLDRQLIEWMNLLRKTLAEINLFNVAALAHRDQQWHRSKPRKEPIPLLPFPMQRHIRKAHIALDIRGEKPKLTIETTGSGNRLPHTMWKRPEDIDLLRAGLLEPGELPEAVAQQLGV